MCGASLAAEPTASPRGAQGRHRALLRPRRLHRAGRAARSRGRARRSSGPYHDRVRAELERHGGTVEKFIGDAVMALFGAPTAHEDDPERAVRAALAIRDFAVEEGLELRVGITTGEALVSLGASPTHGEGMASGDVVNTAARLQSAAPVNGDPRRTRRRTARHGTRSTTESASPVEAKGKAEPISVWEAIAARSRFGVDVAHEARDELVGRDRELAIVRDAFDRARHDRTPQLVTLVGVPGIGKSRLVYELRRHRRGRPESSSRGARAAASRTATASRSGRSPRSSRRRRESSKQTHTETTRPRSSTAPSRTLFDGSIATRAGSSRTCSPLVGLERRERARRRPPRRGLRRLAALPRGARRAAAARARLRGPPLGRRRPARLRRRARRLGDRRPAPRRLQRPARAPRAPTRLGRRQAQRHDGRRSRRSRDEQTATAHRARLLERPVLPAETPAGAARARGGQPALRGAVRASSTSSAARRTTSRSPRRCRGSSPPASTASTATRRPLLQDAAVVGKVFWTGSLRRTRAGDDGARCTHSSARASSRRQRRSSVESEGEWAFAHVLSATSPTDRFPRAERARSTARRAEWIETLGRPEDHAEMLAYHWRSALELARAAGQDTDANSRRRRDSRCARPATAPSRSTPSRRAAAHYGRARALARRRRSSAAPVPARRCALHDRRRTARGSARSGARRAARRGTGRARAEAEILLARTLWDRGRRERAAHPRTRRGPRRAEARRRRRRHAC